MDFVGIFRGFMGSYGNISGFYGILLGIFRELMGFCGIFWEISDYGVLWNFMGFYGNISGFYGIYGIFREIFFWKSVRDCIGLIYPSIFKLQ